MKEGGLNRDFKPGWISDCGIDRNEEVGMRARMVWGGDGFAVICEISKRSYRVSTHAYKIESLMRYPGRISIL